MLALGLPSIMKTLEGLSSAPPKPPPQPKKKKIKKEKHAAAAAVKIKHEEEEEGGPRRSSRVRGIVAHRKEEEEAAEERYERQLGEFLIDGECPKCGAIFSKDHRKHLMSCQGPKPKAGDGSTRGYSLLDKELLSELTEEEKKDSKKRMMARTKALSLSNLIDFTDDHAKFIVIGSRGNPYTITLKDDKHHCTCPDHRFRRHNCKHICLVLSTLGTLEDPDPEAWRDGVERSLDQLIKEEANGGASGSGGGGGGPVEAPLPKDKNAEMAAKFL